MENFPSNSHRAKSETESGEQEPKKIESVVNGTVVRRKKSLGKRFAETFFGGSAKGALEFVFMDVLVPAARETIADALSQGFDRMIFGDSRPSSRRSGGYRYGGNNGYVSYDRYGSSSSSRGRVTPRDREDNYRSSMSRRGRAAHQFDEILLASRPEADTVLDRMYDLLKRYDVVSVSDLYELVGESSDYTDAKWGWTDLRGSRIVRVNEGFVLDLPKPEPID